MAAGGDAKFYPNCDAGVWLRSCEREVVEPIEGTLTGEIPAWIDGCLLRNGPGSIKVGSMEFDHLFDSSALLHRFHIHQGRVTYQCRFLKSETYKKNQAAQRIVVTDFGTRAVPDPCHSIFDRFSSLFKPGEGMSDNALISLYPFGDEIYAFTESPVIHRIDPVTLDTLERKNVSQNVAIVNHTAHPHVASNGDVYNLGISLAGAQVHYAVVKFPYSEKGDMFASASVVARVRARWQLHPSYMHSFGITENYFVIVEQPLAVSLSGMVKAQLGNMPLNSCLRWLPEHGTHIVLVRRSDGVEERRYRTQPLFFLHIINQYEEKGRLVLDLCAYKDARMLDAMYVQSMKTMQANAHYADWFRGRPLRLALPLQPAAAAARGSRVTDVTPERIVDLGCETPRIHYDLHCGRPYRYFYAISSDVDALNPGTIIKVDTETKTSLTWSEENCYPSEAVFIPSPDSKGEDDGVLLSALVWGGGGAAARAVGLLVLRARDLRELARVTFSTPSPAPKCLHGHFLAAARTSDAFK